MPRKAKPRTVGRDELRREAIERIDALLRRAGTPVMWTEESSRQFRPMHERKDTAIAARAAYLALVSALRRADAIVRESPDEPWAFWLREFFKDMGDSGRAWVRNALAFEREDEATAPEKDEGFRRLVQYWATFGVPWRVPTRPGERSRPTHGDLALVALATLGARDLEVREGDDFDTVFARARDRVKKELARLKKRDAERPRTTWAEYRKQKVGTES